MVRIVLARRTDFSCVISTVSVLCGCFLVRLGIILSWVIVSMFVVGFGSDVVYCRPESKIRRNRLWLLWTFSLG